MTTASLVTRLPEQPERRPWPVWISFATPCTGVFVPVYLDGVVPAAFASAGDPESGNGSGSPSVWCAMRDLQERATKDFERTLPLVRAGWSEIAVEIEADRVRVERAVGDLYASQEYDAGAERLSRFMATSAERMLETSQRLLQAV